MRTAVSFVHRTQRAAALVPPTGASV